MIIFIQPNEYIAGIFEDSANAADYFEIIPNGTWKVIKKDIQYPFYIVEQKTPQIEFYIFETKPDISNIKCTLYIIEKDYYPEIPWTDYMGSIEHFHSDELLDDEGLQDES